MINVPWLTVLIVLAEGAQAAASTGASRVRTLRVFPFPPTCAPASVELTWIEDDGVTDDDPDLTCDPSPVGSAASSDAATTAVSAEPAVTIERDRAVISCELYCTPDALRLRARIILHGDGSRWRPAFRTIEVCLPLSEGRSLSIEQECWAGGLKSNDIVFVN